MLGRHRFESNPHRIYEVLIRRTALVLLSVLTFGLALACGDQGDAGGSGWGMGAGQQGPYATQDRAWQRRNEAQSQGRDVSGVFVCYDQYSTRGYCFNLF